MQIELQKIKIKDLVQGYVDNAESGVVAYDGKLDVRPPYQREFVYKDKQREAVIHTVLKGFPLNVMYWATRDDNTFEVIDGQQRTISICQYVNGDFAHDFKYFNNLTKDKQDIILNYELTIYVCTGTDSQKLDWFRIINIAGEKLTDQELLNAVFSGTWVNDAKKYFSKNGCPAYQIASDYLTGSSIRQDYLETAINWISKGAIEKYMSKNQHEPNAIVLWNYFNSVINWVKAIFPKKRKEQKGLNWGALYDTFKDKSLDAVKLESEIKDLMIDEDVTKKSGIYEYVLTRNEKHLNIRAFSDNQKREAYERQKGECVKCNDHFELSQMEADHIKPWHEGGKTTAENCQMLCIDDNRRKSGK